MTTMSLSKDRPHLFSKPYAFTSIGAVFLISMLAFESIALSAAMPAVAQDLQAYNWYGMAFSGNLAASIVGMAFAGDCCDRYGTRLSNLLGTAVFVMGLLFAGFATSMSLLIVGRVVQGLGAGMLGVAIYVGVARAIPTDLHPRLFAMFATAWVVPALVGPAIAATMVDWLGWRSVFLLVAILAPCACGILISRQNQTVSSAHQSNKPALQWRNWLWSGLAGSSVLALNIGSNMLHDRLHLLLLVLASLLCLYATSQLLPIGSLRFAQGLPSVIGLRGLLAAAFFCSEVYLPLLLNQYLGWSLYQAGLVLSAGAIAWSLGSSLQARLSSDRSRVLCLRLGFGLLTLGNSVLALSLYGSNWVSLICLSWLLAGLGIGMAYPLLSVLTIKYSSPLEQGKNTSALQISDALGTSLVLGICANFLQTSAPLQRADYFLILSCCAGLALVCLLASKRAFTQA